MTVEELILKLKKCPKKAQVCWDSNKLQFWFGDNIEIVRWCKGDMKDQLHDETGTIDDTPNFRNIVRLS
jgi:hypothetical protein